MDEAAEKGKKSEQIRERVEKRVKEKIVKLSGLSVENVPRLREALRESEAKFKLIADYSVSAEIFRNEKEKITYVSPAFEKIFGYRAEDYLAGKVTFKDFMHPDDLQKAQDFYTATLNRDLQVEIDFRIIRKDGRLRFISVLSQPVITKEGEFKGRRTSIRDITERKQAEETLRETNAYLDNLFNHANAPIIVWDPQFKITRFNHAFELLTGRSAGEVLGQTLDLLFPPAQVQPTMELIRKALRGERWQTVEIEILHRDGTVRTVLWNSATLFDSDGKIPVATIAQGHDITERKKAEKELKESEAKFRIIFDNANDGMLVTDTENNKFYMANKAICNMLGYSVQEMEKLSIEDIHPKEHVTDILEGIGAQFKDESVPARDISMRRKDGTVFFASVRGSQIEISGGKYILGIFRDITERKNMEEALRRNEARYRSSIELTGQLAWTTDSNGEVVEDIPLWRKFTGLSYEETKGSGWTKVLHPEDAEHTRQVWGKAVKDKNAYEVEFRLRRFDGVYRDFLT
jgi:PAS domain S-box-containing protein